MPWFTSAVALAFVAAGRRSERRGPFEETRSGRFLTVIVAIGYILDM